MPWSIQPCPAGFKPLRTDSNLRDPRSRDEQASDRGTQASAIALGLDLRFSGRGRESFLNDVERAVPAGKLIEAVVDNEATHKHPKVKAWLARHPRWTFHFTPTSGSWLNAAETFFSC